MRFSLKLILPILLWFLFSLRYYPSDFGKTVIETAKIFIGSGLWSLGTVLVVNGLLHRFSKRSLEPATVLRWVLWLAVLTAISASFEHYFGLRR
jgi:hypothetical protein